MLCGISLGLQSRPNEQSLFVGRSVPQALDVGFACAGLGLETVVAREGAAELSRRRLSGHSGALLWESRCGGRRGCACRRLGACCCIRPKSCRTYSWSIWCRFRKHEGCSRTNTHRGETECLRSARVHPHMPPCRKWLRSDENTFELQQLMRISYAVFFLDK